MPSSAPAWGWSCWPWFTHWMHWFCHAGYVPEQAGRPRSGSRGRLAASGATLGAALVLGWPLPASAEAAGPAAQWQITDPPPPELSGLGGVDGPLGAGKHGGGPLAGF